MVFGFSFEIKNARHETGGLEGHSSRPFYFTSVQPNSGIVPARNSRRIIVREGGPSDCMAADSNLTGSARDTFARAAELMSRKRITTSAANMIARRHVVVFSRKLMLDHGFLSHCHGSGFILLSFLRGILRIIASPFKERPSLPSATCRRMK